MRILIVILPLFLSGCFSAMNNMGSSWNGGSSKGSKVVAGGLDVITAPIQAPVLVVTGISEASSKKKYEKMKILDAELTKEIEDDPSIALRDHWEIKSDTHRRVFWESFSNDHVHYTPDLLESIYDRVPDMREYVFRSKACTTEFLVRHFDEAYDRSFHISYVRLASIVANPNTPLTLVEKVAQSDTIPVGAVYPARDDLKSRTEKSEPNQSPEPMPMAVTPPAAQEARQP